MPTRITTDSVVEDNCNNSPYEADEDQRDRCTLFLGDLSLFCAEKDIEDAFRRFGQMVEVRIQRSKETARALSYGFIEFSEPAFAEAALSSMNNFVLKGRPLRYQPPCRVYFVNVTLTLKRCDNCRIGWAANRSNPVKSAIVPHDPAASVYVRFLTMRPDAVVSEEILRNMFSHYGPVFDCAIKKLRRDPVRSFMVDICCVSLVSYRLTFGFEIENEPRQGLCVHQLPPYRASSGRYPCHGS
jgi:RNA recognition motif-containing protein